MYEYKPTKSLLARWEKIKKDKHVKHCNNQWKQISTFVLSVDGMISRYTLVLLSQLIIFMSDKMKELLSQERGWVNVRTDIAIVRSSSQMIRGAQLPSLLR